MAVTINGSAGVTTNSGAVYDSLQRATAVASTSGTSIDFTSIPSWVKRITVMFSGVSTSGTSNTRLQIGSGSVLTSGYTSSALSAWAPGNAISSDTAGFILTSEVTAATFSNGNIVLALQTSNVWVVSGTLVHNARLQVSAGSVSLSGTLDRVRITTVNGTDTFDAGTINIIYE